MCRVDPNSSEATEFRPPSRYCASPTLVPVVGVCSERAACVRAGDCRTALPRFTVKHLDINLILFLLLSCRGPLLWAGSCFISVLMCVVIKLIELKIQKTSQQVLSCYWTAEAHGDASSSANEKDLLC